MSLPLFFPCMHMQFQAPSVPSSVEAYLAVSPGPQGYKAHYATWQSAVLGFASIPALRALRASSKVAPGSAVKPPGPRPRPPSGIEYIKHPSVKSFSVPFPGEKIWLLALSWLRALQNLPVHVCWTMFALIADL